MFLFHSLRGQRVILKHRSELEATRRRTEIILWDFINLFDIIYKYILPTQTSELLMDIDNFLFFVNHCLVNIINKNSPAQMPTFKTKLKLLINFLRAKIHHNRDVINIRFAFLRYSDELNQMKILHNELLEAFNSSSEYISVKLKTVCPKYLGKVW